jgi:hypothetical protein
VAAKKHRKQPSPQELQSWDLLGEFRSLLEEVPSATLAQSPSRKGGAKRLLEEEDYLCAFLFAQFNPVIDSMRGLCACSQFERVQEEVCSRPMSLGSFSEAQSVFGYERLEGVFEKLVEAKLKQVATGSDKTSRDKALRLLRLVDSTVIRAVPRMEWAQWRHQHKTQRAVRLHLKFNLVDQEPAGAVVSDGRKCERKALGDMLREGEFYVGDRYYGRDYKFLEEMTQAGCGYIMRLYEQAHMSVEQSLPLEEEDKAAGVVSDEIVQLGARACWQHGLVRVIRIEKPSLKEPVLIVTNHLEGETLSAALAAEIYRQRWSIELFFRWLKCVLKKSTPWHWMAESANGAAIQLYCALIAALLLARRLGKLPNKRVIEALRFHAMGMASTEELERFLPKHAAFAKS